MLYALIGILFLFADQLLKFWTVSHIELNAYPGKELIPGVLNMTYIKNTGMAFGLFSKFSGLRWVLLALLAAFTAFIVLGIVLRYLRTGFARFTGTLLLAGLLGNGIDRAIYGYVVDMFEPTLGSITWPIFNLADCLVVVFGILFCIAVLAGGLGAPDRDLDDEDEEEEEEEEEPVRRRSRRSRDEDEEEAPRRRARDEDEEEAPRRRARREDDEEAPRRKPRRVRDEDEEEAPRRRPRREDGEEETRRARRVRSEEEEAPHRKRPVRNEDEEVAPVRRRPRPVRTDDEDVIVAPERRRAPQAAESDAKRREAPESEATVSTVARPAPAKTPAAPAAEPKPAPKAEVPAAPKTEEKPAPKADKDEFDLDSILAEFK